MNSKLFGTDSIPPRKFEPSKELRKVDSCAGAFPLPPVTDDETENKDTSFNFNSPADYLGRGSNSPRNAIEKQFSINMKHYQNDNLEEMMGSSSKARLTSGLGHS